MDDTFVNVNLSKQYLKTYVIEEICYQWNYGRLIQVLNFFKHRKNGNGHLSLSLLLTENATSMWDGLSFVRCLVFTLKSLVLLFTLPAVAGWWGIGVTVLGGQATWPLKFLTVITWTRWCGSFKLILWVYLLGCWEVALVATSISLKCGDA